MRILHVPYVRKVYICENAETSSDLCGNIIQDAEMSFSVPLVCYCLSPLPHYFVVVNKHVKITESHPHVIFQYGMGSLSGMFELKHKNKHLHLLLHQIASFLNEPLSEVQSYTIR